MTERYRLMEAERGSFPVPMMARTLGVSRSGFYAWLRRPRSESDPWAAAREAVRGEHEAARGIPGARTLLALVAPRFPGVTLYRVRRLMRELGIRGVHPRAPKRTTVPDPDAPERPDLVRRGFDRPVPTCWLVGDITYLRTGQGWLCMAVAIDLCTRMVVGCSFSERMDASLPIAALECAWRRGYVAEGAVFHSDRGSQYTSKAMAEWAAAHGVRLSVGRTGSCRDNAVAESFFGTFKNEMYHRRPFATRDEARVASVGYVEGYYNRRRPHSSIGYECPASKMEAFMRRMEELAEREAALPLAA